MNNKNTLQAIQEDINNVLESYIYTMLTSQCMSNIKSDLNRAILKGLDALVLPYNIYGDIERYTELYIEDLGGGRFTVSIMYKGEPIKTYVEEGHATPDIMSAIITMVHKGDSTIYWPKDCPPYLKKYLEESQ